MEHSSVLRCCAANCSTVLSASPPNCLLLPEEPMRVVEWLACIGREDLIHLPLEELRGCHFVCLLHFLVFPDPVYIPPPPQQQQQHHILHPFGQNAVRQMLVQTDNPYWQPTFNSYRQCTDNAANQTQTDHRGHLQGSNASASYVQIDPSLTNWGQIGGPYPRNANGILNPTLPTGTLKTERVENTPFDRSSGRPRGRPAPGQCVEKDCRVCSLRFYSLDEYRSHMLSRHRKKFCEKCDKLLITRYYKEHEHQKHCKGRDKPLQTG